MITKKFFPLWIMVLAVGMAPTLAQPQPAPEQTKPQDKFQMAQVFQFTPKAVSMDYLLFLPKDYDAATAAEGKKWPVILFLHGAGERGTNVWRVNFHGPSKYILQHPEFPFILVTPLCPAGETWSNERLMALLDETLKKYKADSRRVYLTGLSMGGFGTWNLGTKYPERFAAIAPICGGGQRIEVLLIAKGFAPEKQAFLKTLPVWAFHGAKDKVVPLSESEQMIKALADGGVDMTKVKLTVYPEAQHDSWTETYNNPELYEWFLQQERLPVVKK